MVLGRKKHTAERPRQRNAIPRDTRPVFSYYNSAGSQRNGQPAPEKTINLSNKSHKLRLAPSIIALIVIGISLLYSMTLSTNPSVTMLNDVPSPYRPVQEYAEAASQILSQKFTNQTKLTVQSSAVEDALMERFPELNAVVLRLPVLGRRPNLILDVSPPALIITSDSKNYVVDKSGVVISDLKALSDENRKGLLAVQDQSGIDAVIGNQVVPSETISFISIVVAQLKAKEIQIEQIILPLTANQLDIRMENIPYYLKTDLSGDARLQVGSFLAVKNNLEEQGITPGEYIDVRVEEKVFYK